MTDGDYVDPLSGSGISGDDHGEESWPGESPWDDLDVPGHIFSAEDEASKTRRKQATYKEEIDGGQVSQYLDQLDRDDSEYGKRAREIRGLSCRALTGKEAGACKSRHRGCAGVEWRHASATRLRWC